MSIGEVSPRVLLLAFLSAACLQGCAQITVISDEKPPKSEWHFGVLSVDIPASSKNAIVTASGIGLISNPSGTALGYSSGRFVRLGDDCRLVIQLPESQQAARHEELVRLLKSIPHACGA
jgi:hypothetical protein